jgi:hypothetical protein
VRLARQSEVPRVKQITFTQLKNHALFVVYDGQFVPLRDMKSSVQETSSNLAQTKACIDKQAGGPETKPMASDAVKLQGIDIRSEDTTTSIRLDLMKLRRPVLIGLEACCKSPSGGVQPSHPAQFQRLDTEARPALQVVEVQYDDAAHDCKSATKLRTMKILSANQRAVSIRDEAPCGIAVIKLSR